jgi:hypothetical protein
VSSRVTFWVRPGLGWDSGLGKARAVMGWQVVGQARER